MGEMFRVHTGVRAAHVPYQQFPQAISDLLNGTNHFMFIAMLPVVDLIKTGKLRALATTAPKRLTLLNEVPSIAEEGFPALVVQDWVGFAVKKGTPKTTTDQLNAAVNRALVTPNTRATFEKIGAEPAGGSSAEFRDLLQSQVSHWAKIVKEAGIKLPQ